MGLGRLYLVEPKKFPHQNALDLAAGAVDILTNAVVVDSLEQAVADCHLVVGASARMRTMPIECLAPQEMAKTVVAEAGRSEVALVFGREHAGLTNEELLQCHYHMMIPTTAEFSSLNLSQAVQVMCYEVYGQHISSESKPQTDYDALASNEELENFYRHLESLLLRLEFIQENKTRPLMSRLRRLFQRTRLEHLEVNILRGMISAVDRRMGRKSIDKGSV